MTELRLRLIRNGKIVGEIIAEHHGGGNVGWTSQAWDIHDSFDMGIKVGDEWWFEGDIGEWEADHGEKHKAVLTYNSRKPPFAIGWLFNDGTELDVAFRMFHAKRISSIYNS